MLGQWLRRHLLPHPLQLLRLLPPHQAALVAAHQEQVEQRQEAPLVEVLEVRPEREVRLEREALPALEPPPRAPLERSLAQFQR